MQTAFLIYSFLYLIVLLILLPKEYFKRNISIRNRWIKEKFGFFNHSDDSKISEKLDSKPKIWIHAVSVGEVIAISNLIKKLSSEYEIVLSTITDTGQKVAQEKFRYLPVRVIYMPFDIPSAINRTLKYFNPSALILTETEIWPNLIRLASKKIPVILVNGRLSRNSFKGYIKIKFFIKHLLKSLELLCVQEQDYKERFISLGADEKRICVTGNMKFDIELKKISFSWENLIPRPIILAGSTHELEEEIILDTFLKINIPATLIIAPRHPERFERVENLIKSTINLPKKEIFFSKLSNLSLLSLKPDSCIILLDKVGILGSLYRVCDIAIVGGSFIPHGGQNPLEPIYWKKPVIFGPHMYNFPFIEEFLKERACFMVDKDSLLSVMKELIENSEMRQQTGEKAYQLFLTKSGATERTINLLKKILSLSKLIKC